MTGLRILAAATMLAVASRAGALPVELKDSNGTRYNINTDVDPLINFSNASGALTDATYVKPVTVTSYFLGLTPFGFFFTTYTVQRQVNIPLSNAFAGFNGLVISGLNGTALPQALVFNPGEGLTSEQCSQNGKNRELVFPSQTLPAANLSLTRRVFVPDNAEFVRWINVVTNLADTPREVGITLQGLLGSGSDTKVGTTSDGDSTVTNQDLWFTSGQKVPQGVPLTQPTIGFLVQGAGAPAPAVSLGINSVGQAIATYRPTIPAGGSAVILTLATVQGNFKHAKKQIENLVDLPSSALRCMSEQDLAQVVNFPQIAAPEIKSATIQLKFNKTGADTINWKGKITIGAGITLTGQPVSLDIGGATASFILNKQGKANNGDGNKFALNAKLQNGVTKVATVNFSFQMKGDFQALLAPYGLTNATVKNAPVTVPVTLTVGTAGFRAGGDRAFNYTATAGKSGKAKNS